MLIIYPTNDWQTFLSETEADSFMAKQRNDGGWSTFTTDQKELLLIMTCDQIRLCPNVTLPDTNEVDLKEGQSHLLLQASRNDLTVYDASGKFVTKEKVGSLEVSYSDNRYKFGDVGFPPLAELYLTQYGCSGGGGGFSQSKVK